MGVGGVGWGLLMVCDGGGLVGDCQCVVGVCVGVCFCVVGS